MHMKAFIQEIIWHLGCATPPIVQPATPRKKEVGRQKQHA